jgi:hypothetical protein
MSIDKARAQIIGNIWQAFAQSGVDLSAVPKDQQERLVSKIADQMLVTVDSLLDEATDQSEAIEPTPGVVEEELWKGRPFLSLVEYYAITTERLRIVRGMLSRNIENFELIRIQDIDFKQGITERMMGIGDITIRGHDPSDAMIVLRNVREPEQIYELLRKAWLEARKRHGLQFREYM